jgi:nucleoside-triphosphatase THEP1
MPESHDDKPQVLLITGRPGIGKTTIIRRAADRLKGEGLRGFTPRRSGRKESDAAFAS